MMSETPAADPVTAEDEMYTAIVSDYQGLRRAGASAAAALLTAGYRVLLGKANEA